MKGIHVEVLDRIGKFSRIQYAGNGIVAYAYNSDIANVVAPAPEPEKTIIVRTLDKIKRVDSMTEDREVMLMNGKPTVNLLLTTKDSALELIVVKDVLKTGFKIHAENQQNGAIQISVHHKKESRGFSSPDYVDFEVIERNDVKKYIDIRVSGFFNKFDREKNKDFELKPATLRISGAQYTEAIRPHTAKELAHPFRDSSGRTT